MWDDMVRQFGKEKAEARESGGTQSGPMHPKAHLILEGSERHDWGVVKDCLGRINYVPEGAQVVGTWHKYGSGTFWVSLLTPLKALEDMVEIYKNGWVAPGALKKSWGDVQDEFRAGNAAMTDMFTEALTILELPDQSAVAGKTGYYVIPKYQQFHTRLSAWMIGINSKSKNAEAAYKYIAWLTSPEIDRRLVTDTKTAARMPARIGTHYDPEVVRIMPVLMASADSFNIAIPWPLYPEFMELYEFLSNAIQDAITGTKSPEQALNDTADQMREVMERAGKLK